MPPSANILEGYDLAEMGWGSAEAIHHYAEAARRAYADRNQVLADPDFVAIPLATMIAKDYARSRGKDIDPRRATPSAQVGPGLAVVRPEPTETTHFSIVDRWGNAVAITTTLNSAYGSLVTVAGAGFLLNNEMDDFAANPGHPNQFGLVEGEQNAIAPGKRMLSSMSPTIVVDPAGELFFVTGTPGGSTIITTVLQTVLHDRTRPEEIIPRAQAAEIILTNKTPLDRAILQRLPGLRYIGVLATGYNVVDVAAARELGVLVTNVPSYGTRSVAQHVFALLLELTQRTGHHAESVRKGKWTDCPDFCYRDHPLIELDGLTLGVVGFGRIGQATTRQGGADPAPGVRGVDLEALLAESDVISLHCPLTSGTTGLINA